MITVKVSHKNKVIRVTSEGHAESRVCAAVSALLYSLMGSWENQLDGGKKCFKVSDGHFDIRYVPATPEDEAAAAVIFNTVLIGLMQISKSHPDEIKIIH